MSDESYIVLFVDMSSVFMYLILKAPTCLERSLTLSIFSDRFIAHVHPLHLHDVRCLDENEKVTRKVLNIQTADCLILQIFNESLRCSRHHAG